MSEKSEPPQPYDVVISGRVRDRIRQLAVEARVRGDGEAFLTAIQQFFHRLRIYPQFGDPLIDLQRELGQIRIGIVPPIAMRFVLLEERRQVFVTALPVLLPRTV